MVLKDMLIRQATVDDVEGILKLASIDGPTPSGEWRGGLSIILVREAVEATIKQIPCVVAYLNGRLIGFILTWEKGDPTQASLTQSMTESKIILKMLETYPGEVHPFIYGPTEVDPSLRGQSIAVAMFNEVCRLNPGREGVTFNRTLNRSSHNVHEKQGMHKVATFMYQNAEFEVYAFFTDAKAKAA